MRCFRWRQATFGPKRLGQMQREIKREIHELLYLAKEVDRLFHDTMSA